MSHPKQTRINRWRYCSATVAVVCLNFAICGAQAHPHHGGLANGKALPDQPVVLGEQSQSAVTDGLWTTLPYLMPINPIHCALLHTGKVLIVSGSENDPPEHDAGEFYAGLWDPQAGTITVQSLIWDLFCNGMAALPDGRIIVVGGSMGVSPAYGDPRATIFDPATEKLNQVESMAHGRWYASVIELSDGSMMTFSGLEEEEDMTQTQENERGVHNQSVEIYHVGTGWSPQYEAQWIPPLYPRMHLLPNGTVFYSGDTPDSSIFDPATQTWTLNVATTVYPNMRVGGSSVLLPLSPSDGYAPRVMIFGGALGGRQPPLNMATDTAEIIDLSMASPSWRMTPPMSAARSRLNAVILPTGKILALGGSSTDEDPTTASLGADLFDPATETWTSAGVAVYPRLYHSCAILMPDATVWVVGSNPMQGSYEQHMEVYSPAYLYTVDDNGDVIPAVRPTISSAPSEVGYGAPFKVGTPDTAQIASAVLIHLGSSSHSFDFDQRFIGLTYTSSNRGLTATAPPNSSIAPPGFYMLFLLNQAGVPSLAKMIHLSSTPRDLTPKGTILSPTEDLAISPGDSVDFSGSATDPDGTNVTYSWIFPAGTPASSSLASPGSVTFTEVGTHVVSFTAIDSLGVNDPSPSTRTIIVKGASLPLSFTQPAADSTVTGKKVAISVSATGTMGSSNTFTVSVDGTVIGSKTGNAVTASFIWATKSFAAGPHTLSTTVTDSSGNAGSASESVTLQ